MYIQLFFNEHIAIKDNFPTEMTVKYIKITVAITSFCAPTKNIFIVSSVATTDTQDIFFIEHNIEFRGFLCTKVTY